ncbi:MAG: tetrahydrofolate dehydrogenase/cyclohydrolase catalytic domain-containing protein, partial [Candidatus Thermoplasmatota archaeon]|nr:tetrahydrofolate dehydrogenase/cyclohydrolase catalytic domain-containing protein [Candidatus Thermoplasmatota archaeon]
MSATIIDGKAVAEEILSNLKNEISGLKSNDVHPALAVVLVGDDPASAVYVRMKGQDCEKIGIKSITIKKPATMTENELLDLVAQLNDDKSVHGILVQLPVPKQIDEKRIIAAIDPRKDIDGLNSINVGNLVTGGQCLESCTPAGVMELLHKYKVPIEGKHAVVIGRSNLVGKPVALMLLRENATVTICHSRTKNLAEIVRQGDIIVAAVGKAKMVTGDMIKPGAVVIDVGTTKMENGKLCGDVDFDAAK